MKRRALLFFIAALALILAACQPNQEFGPNATDVDLWERYDIRIDTEVPNQYPDGRSGLSGAAVDGVDTGAEPAEEGADH